MGAASGHRQNTVLTNDLGQFRLGSGPVRDSEIELRPAHLCWDQRNNANTAIVSQEWETGGLAAGLQTRAANHPLVFIITEKAPTRATYTMFRCLAEVVS